MFSPKPKYFDSDDVKFSYALSGIEAQLNSVKQTLTLFSKSSFATCPEQIPECGIENIQELVSIHNSLQNNARLMKEFPGFKAFVLQHEFQKTTSHFFLF